MKQPLISIGLPVFNGEKFIEQSLKSLIAQTYINFEIIISDNNSSDNTFKICEKYAKKDNRIKLIRQSKNIGGIQNFNFVLRFSKGKYFTWQGGDDLRHKK